MLPSASRAEKHQRAFGDAKPSLLAISPRRSTISRSADATKIIALAARQNRFRQAMRFGGRQNKLDRRRRLFQSLQKRIESVFGDLVHFVDDVDLKAAFRRLVADVLDDLAHLIDAAIRRAVDLKHVDSSCRW